MAYDEKEIEKANLLGEGIVGCALEAANFLVEQLQKYYQIGFRAGSWPPQFIIEVIVFYMHLVDRLAFVHFGAEKREVFGDRFVVAVMKEFLHRMSRELSADDLGKRLRDTHNRRQLQYGAYKVLIPEKAEPLKDTLYWEFSKIVFGFFDDSNPATLIHINMMIADLTKLMLYDALKVEDVLSD
jgi:hypothetical protein